MLHRSRRRVRRAWALARRLFLAIYFADRLRRQTNETKRALIRRMGGDWLERQLPNLDASEVFWESSKTLLQTAWRPAVNRSTMERTRRLREHLNGLRNLSSRSYTVHTSAGRALYAAAMTRCLREIGDTLEDGKRFFSVDLGTDCAPGVPLNGLIDTLVKWLERICAHGTSTTSEPILPLILNTTATTTAAMPHGSQPGLELQEVHERQRLSRQAQWAEQELRTRFQEEKARKLLLPTALLTAMQQQADKAESSISTNKRSACSGGRSST